MAVAATAAFCQGMIEIKQSFEALLKVEQLIYQPDQRAAKRR